jgi:hypothetical protein
MRCHGKRMIVVRGNLPRLAAASLIECVVCCSGGAVLGWVPRLDVSWFRDLSFA